MNALCHQWNHNTDSALAIGSTISQRVTLCSEMASASSEAACAESSAGEACVALLDGYSFQDVGAALIAGVLTEAPGLDTVISDASKVNGRPRLKLARLT